MLRSDSGLFVCRFHCVVKVVPVGGTNDILSVYSKARRPILYSEMLMGGAYEMLVSAGTKNVTSYSLMVSSG